MVFGSNGLGQSGYGYVESGICPEEGEECCCIFQRSNQLGKSSSFGGLGSVTGFGVVGGMVTAFYYRIGYLSYPCV